MEKDIKYNSRQIKVFYQELLEAQDHKCAICGKFDTEERNGMLQVDHEHITGLVRGLLCHSCNTMLGHAHDEPKILSNGADYLQNWLIGYFESKLYELGGVRKRQNAPIFH